MERMQEDLSHHNRLEYCTNRLSYRDGRKLTAVKVYTIVNESKYLLVFGVPRINLLQEVKQLFAKYGRISSIQKITDKLINNETIEIEQFTDCYYIEYEKIHFARRAKAFVDRKNFYGGILHVSYAPEYETVADVREKLKSRKRDVRYNLNKAKISTNASKKRHRPHKNDLAYEPLPKKQRENDKSLML